MAALFSSEVGFGDSNYPGSIVGYAWPDYNRKHAAEAGGTVQ